MSNEPKFELVNHWDIYTSPYTDPNENKWIISLIGPTERIKSFLENAKIVLYAEPLSPEAAQQTEAAIAQAKQELEQRGIKLLAGAVAEISLPAEAPELQGDIWLVGLSKPGLRHHIHFAVEMAALGSTSHCLGRRGYQPWNFHLCSGDSTANVSFLATGGTVQLFLTGNGLPTSSSSGTSGEARSNLIWGSNWTVTVVWRSGTPCYTLGGDFTSSC